MEIYERDPTGVAGVTAMITTKDLLDISKIKYSELSSLEDCLVYFPNMSDRGKTYLRRQALGGQSWLKDIKRTQTSELPAWLKGIQRTGEYVRIKFAFPKLHKDIRLYRLFFLMEKGHDIVRSTVESLREIFPEEDKRYYTDYKKYSINPKEAFEHESKDLDLSLGFFHQELLELKNQRLGNGKLAGYVNIYQSAGTGKSRVATELYKEGIYVIYCSFSKRNSTGHPKRSFIARELCAYSNGDFYPYIAACLELVVACWCFGILPKTFHRCITDDNIERGVGEWLKNRMRSIKDPLDIIFICMGIINQEEHSEALTVNKDEICKIFNVTKSEKIKLRKDKLFAVFVFDKVSNLTECHIRNIHYLNLLKKALNELPCELNVFSLLLDTSLMLDEVIRMKEYTKSEKRPSDNFQRHMPICIFGSKWNKFDKINNKNIFSPSRLYKIGRPMWSAFLQGKSESMLPKMLEFAREKLMNNDSTLKFMDDKNISEIRPLIVFGPLLDLNVLNVGLVEQLVSENMSFIYSISTNLKLVRSTYPPEPILSSAAITIFQGEHNRKLLIEELSAAIHAGNISQGECGEIAARLLLLLAKIETKSSDSDSHNGSIFPVYLEDYLETLGGVDAKKVLENRSDLKEAKVFFNAFIKRDRTPDLDSLLFHFTMCLAIICKDSQVGVDVIIPVWCPNQHGYYELKAANMSFVAFSIKNHSSSFSPKDVFEHTVEKTTAKRIGIKTTRDYMCILMALNRVSKGGPSFDPRAVYKSALEDKLQKLNEEVKSLNQEIQTEEAEEKQKEKKESLEKMKNRQEKLIVKIKEIDNAKDKKQVFWALAGLKDSSYSFIKSYTPSIGTAIKELITAKIDFKKKYSDKAKKLYTNFFLNKQI